MIWSWSAWERGEIAVLVLMYCYLNFYLPRQHTHSLKINDPCGLLVNYAWQSCIAEKRKEHFLWCCYTGITPIGGQMSLSVPRKSCWWHRFSLELKKNMPVMSGKYEKTCWHVFCKHTRYRRFPHIYTLPKKKNTFCVFWTRTGYSFTSL